MHIHFDRAGKSSVKFTKTEMQALQKAKGIVGALADHCRNCELADLADSTDKSLTALVEVLSAEDPMQEAHDRFVGEVVS